MKVFNDGIKRKVDFCVLAEHASEKIRVIELVHPLIMLVLIVFNESKHFKNIFQSLVTISIPKVAKNGQKVPTLANNDFRLTRQN